MSRAIKASSLAQECIGTCGLQQSETDALSLAQSDCMAILDKWLVAGKIQAFLLAANAMTACNLQQAMLSVWGIAHNPPTPPPPPLLFHQ